MIDEVELAERCEKASGPDLELDALIHEAFGKEFVMEYWSEADTVPQRNLSWVPRYTASLDAAMSLVPKDYHCDLRGVNQSWTAVLNPTPAGSTGCYGAFAATPALALTAACLRARATERVNDGE